MQHPLGPKKFKRTGGCGWRAFIVGGDPGRDGCGDCAVVSPTNDEVVVGGGGVICGGSCGGAERWATGSCRPWRLFFGPGVAKPRPGKSSQGGWCVFPAYFGNVCPECILFIFRDSGCTNVAGFVGTVDKAFATDVPASTHEDFVVPLGAIVGALAGKMFFPVFAVL